MSNDTNQKLGLILDFNSRNNRKIYYTKIKKYQRNI